MGGDRGCVSGVLGSTVSLTQGTVVDGTPANGTAGICSTHGDHTPAPAAGRVWMWQHDRPTASNSLCQAPPFPGITPCPNRHANTIQLSLLCQVPEVPLHHLSSMQINCVAFLCHCCYYCGPCTYKYWSQEIHLCTSISYKKVGIHMIASINYTGVECFPMNT